MRRIITKEELLEFTIERYNFYNQIFKYHDYSTISRYYLQDFMQDLLLIQNFASSKDDPIQGDGEG